MIRFFRYVFRSREGVRDYLMYLGAVLGSLFLVHIITLIVLINSEEAGLNSMSFYEVLGAPAAGFGCAALLNRLLRTSVSFGVSRKQYLRGMLCILPLLALITAVIIQLIFVFTDCIFHLGGCHLDCLVLALTYAETSDSPYELRVFLLNVVCVFCLCIVSYGAALLYAGCKNRLHKFAGFFAAGAYSFICYNIIGNAAAEPYLYYQYYGTWDTWTYFRYYFLDYILQMIFTCINPEYFVAHTPMRDSFYPGVLLLTALTAVWYLFIYAVFALLTKRTAVCGKEEGGKI